MRVNLFLGEDWRAGKRIESQKHGGKSTKSIKTP